MKTGTSQKMKFRKLQRRLGMDRKQTAGILNLMWEATVRNAPAGDIGRFSNEEIAIECDWEGDPDQLINALVECRWLDRSKNHRLLVHNWADHVPNHVKANLARHGKKVIIPKKDSKIEKGNDSKIPAACSEQPAQTSLHSAACTEQPALGTLPSSQVKSSLVKSSLLKSSESPNGDSCPSDPADAGPAGRKHVGRKPRSTKDPLFDRFWGIYPRREGKTKALQRFTEAVKRIAGEKSISRAEAAELLIERAVAFAKSPKGQSGQFCPMAQRWLYEGRWDDDPATWEIDPKESQLTPAQRRKRSISKVMENFLAKEDSDDTQ